MRTTLTLDDDIADMLKEQAHLLELPFKQVVNDALRRGLSPRLPEERPVFRVKTFKSEYAPGFDPLKIKEFLNDLDDQHFREVSARIMAEQEQKAKDLETEDKKTE